MRSFDPMSTSVYQLQHVQEQHLQHLHIALPPIDERIIIYIILRMSEPSVEQMNLCYLIQ